MKNLSYRPGVRSLVTLMSGALLMCFAVETTFAAQAIRSQNVETGFYPYGGAEELTIVAINSAKQSIFLAADNINSGAVLKSLSDARKRGVNVLAVLSKNQEKLRYKGAKLLVKEGIKVHIDRKHAGMNNNYIVIDGETLQLGRFNYTVSSAKSNADNVLVLWKTPEIAKAYRANWQEHWDHSDVYK